MWIFHVAHEICAHVLGVLASLILTLMVFLNSSNAYAFIQDQDVVPVFALVERVG